MREFFRWRPHPWHGLEPGPNAPLVLTAYIELTPFDTVKYEVDKKSGYLRVDRPQRTSARPPTPYGFVPRTYCGEKVAALSPTSKRGDGDPLDICVLSERPIEKTDILLDCRVIGGVQMVDDGEADDKIIAVLLKDNVLSKVDDVSEMPSVHGERIAHYFETYKMVPGAPSSVSIEQMYGRDHALEVVKASLEDYVTEFGEPSD